MPIPRQWSRYLIYFILFALPLERIPSFELFIAGQGVTIRLSQLAAILLITINLPLLWSRRDSLWRRPWLWLTLFLGTTTISALLAHELAKALFTTLFIVFVALVSWTLSLTFEKERINSYARSLFAGALLSLGIGVFQFFGDLAGLPTWMTGLRDQYTRKVFGFPRIQSTGLEPLYYANYLLIPISIGAAFFVSSKRKMIWILLIALTVLWMTVSRGAYAGVAVSLLTALWILRPGWKVAGKGALLVVASVGLAYSLIAFGGSIDRDKSTDASVNVKKVTKQATNISHGESSEGRGTTRELAWSAFTESPLFGIGPGNFGNYAQESLPEKYESGKTIVNNEPLEILAEHGAIGFTLFLTFAFSLFRFSLHAFKLADDYHKIWIAGLIAALMGIAVQYQTFSTLYITHIWVAIGILAALVLPQASKSSAA